MEEPPKQRVRFGSGPGLAERILQHVRVTGVPSGEHLSAQALADRLGASRTPINQALRLLAERGRLRYVPNRGFFVGDDIDRHAPEPASDPIGVAYQALARDRLDGSIGDEVTEGELLLRYGLTRSQTGMLLDRVAREGWIERRAGYGWAFTEMLTTAGSLAETFRFRRILEPASLLEPGYKLDADQIAVLRRNEHNLLSGKLADMPLDTLFEQRAMFHEALVAGSGNRFSLDAVRRVNRIRRLLSYRGMGERGRYVRQCEEHLAILERIEAGRNAEAADLLRQHLETVQKRYETILLGDEGPPSQP